MERAAAPAGGARGGAVSGGAINWTRGDWMLAKGLAAARHSLQYRTTKPWMGADRTGQGTTDSSYAGPNAATHSKQHDGTW
jgi:hypothetical protein